MIESALAFFRGFERDGLVCIGLVAVIVFLATSTRRSAKRCPRCQEVNREQAIFCAQCGTRLKE
ncbi:MAG: zinc ribbon domain-containing protein [Phycisphaerales bacterium]|nr:MAG: zinc ribbon domain-containing protein [Phycisphaerales bacterium]